MRKIIVSNIISLDGYHTAPDNDVSVMFPMMGGVFDTYTAERLREADMTLVGRVSFQLFNSFWPEVAKDPTSDRRLSGIHLLDRHVSSAGLRHGCIEEFRDGGQQQLCAGEGPM